MPPAVGNDLVAEEIACLSLEIDPEQANPTLFVVSALCSLQARSPLVTMACHDFVKDSTRIQADTVILPVMSNWLSFGIDTKSSVPSNSRAPPNDAHVPLRAAHDRAVVIAPRDIAGNRPLALIERPVAHESAGEIQRRAAGFVRSHGRIEMSASDQASPWPGRRSAHDSAHSLVFYLLA